MNLEELADLYLEFEAFGKKVGVLSQDCIYEQYLELVAKLKQLLDE